MTFLDAIKSASTFRDWLSDWIAHGEPALTGRDAEIVAAHIERYAPGMSEAAYIHSLMSKFPWRDQQAFADASEEAEAVFLAINPTSDLGSWVKDRTIEILRNTAKDMSKELDNLTRLYWEFNSLQDEAKWVREKEPQVMARAHI